MILPDLETWRWTLGAACALMIGVAKTGAPGLAMLTVPLMVFAVGDARLAAAWTAPMLIVPRWRSSAERRASSHAQSRGVLPARAHL